MYQVLEWEELSLADLRGAEKGRDTSALHRNRLQAPGVFAPIKFNGVSLDDKS